MRLSILILLASAFAAPGQIVSFGVKAGVPLRDAQPYHAYEGTMIDTGRWTVGPTMELRLQHGLSLEVDALYRGYRYTYSTFVYNQAGTGLYSSYLQETKAWDFPALLKYRFKKSPMRPFIDAGVAVSREAAEGTDSLTCTGTAQACRELILGGTGYQHYRFGSVAYRFGPAAGVGVEFTVNRIKIAPELRYNRLDRAHVNQLTVLCGFTF